jgi:hypothetical protein
MATSTARLDKECTDFGLPQAGIVAQQLLEERLQSTGYTQSKHTHGYWTHEWGPISFTLVVDNFGIKYIGKDHAMHLILILKEHYKVKEDWDGKQYLGITMDWDYKNHEAHLSMPKYVECALVRSAHPTPDKSQHKPHPHTIPTYGAKVKYAKPEDTSRKLSPTEKKFIQEVIGVLLYYSCTVDSTMLTALSVNASAQAKPTEDTMNSENSYWTTQQCTPMQFLHTRKATWYLSYTVTRHTSANPRHAAEPEDTFSSPKTQQTQATKEQCSTSHNSSRQLYTQQRKQNLEHFTSMHSRPSPNVRHWKKWDTSNH